MTRLPIGRFRREAFRRVAAALLAERSYDEADAVLGRALAAYPVDAGFRYSFALSANDRGHFAEALSRWSKACVAAPDDARGWCGVAANFRSLEEFDRARATIDEALGRFAGDPCVKAEAARIAMARRELDVALDYWDQALASEAPHPDWFFGRADALMRLRRFRDAAVAIERLREMDAAHAGIEHLLRALQDDLPIPIWTTRPEAGIAIAPDRLFSSFESLGDNCEFGLVQRYCHAEPLGLFRFACSTAESLTAVVSRRFADCGTKEDVALLVNGTDGGYDCRSLRYDFECHTETYPGQIEPDALLQRELKKIAYLKKRLMSDIVTAEKIFVRKGGAYARNVELFHALRALGPITFLWIEPADASHPAGSIERVEDGLFKGYISRFAPYGNAHDIDMLCWAELCCKAMTASQGKAGASRHYHLERNRIHRMGLLWAFTDLCVGSDVAAPISPVGTTQRLVLKERTSRDKAVVAARLIDFDLEPRAHVVFSLWIWIPETFRGSFVDVYITNSPVAFVSMADITRRDVWQRAWTSARLPKTQRNAAVGLRVTGEEGDTIFIGAWRLESGMLPDAWDLEVDIGADAAA